ncbi:MAG: type II toxin-antitoxin system RelE/ParE family toxin [Cyclobacteriaceae bacterium]
MSFSIKTIPVFDKKTKRLAKKYPSFKTDLIQLLDSLRQDPFQGSPLGNSCYKVRLRITSKGKGKSGGGRLIAHIRVTNETIYLLSVYDKSEMKTITDQDIVMLLGLIQ